MIMNHQQQQQHMLTGSQIIHSNKENEGNAGSFFSEQSNTNKHHQHNNTLSNNTTMGGLKPQQPAGLRTPLGNRLESKLPTTPSYNNNMNTVTKTPLRSTSILNHHTSSAHKVTFSHNNNLSLGTTTPITSTPRTLQPAFSNNGTNTGVSSMSSSMNSTSKVPMRRRSKRSSLNYVLINLQSLFKTKHVGESKILAEALRQDYRSPLNWYKALSFLFYQYATPTNDYDDINLHEGRFNLQQIYHLTMPHINQKHRQSANELDEGSRASIDEKVMTLTMQQMYLLYLLSSESVQSEYRVKMEDLKGQLKALFYTRTVDSCSLFYALYAMTMSETQKCLTYLNFARQKQAKPEHIISDAELYIKTHQTMSGFNPMVYFEQPEPLIAPATPMSSVRSALNTSSPTVDEENVEEPVLLAPTSVGKRKRESSDLLPNSYKISRTGLSATPKSVSNPSDMFAQPISQPTSQPQSTPVRSSAGSFVAPRPVQPSDMHHPIVLNQQTPQSSSATASRASLPNQDSTTFYVNNKPYRLIEWLGKGGSSKVYRVIAPDSKIVALKIVNLKDHDKQTLDGFVNEVQLLHKLKGKSNIIELKDFEVQKDYLMIVMECGDSDLNTVLRMQRGKVLPSNQIRLYCQQMLEALNTIHEQRIVHSDLKPANFLFVKGQLKLIDFGIAKQIRSDTTNIMRDSQVGTVNYIPPEAFLSNTQATSNARGNPRYKLGRSSDLWSFGCIMYQMVYGAPPFASLDLIPKIHAITNVNYKIQYPALPAGMDPNILYVLKSTLVRNPEQRATIPQLLECDFLVPHKPGHISVPREYLSNVVASLVRNIKPDATHDGETFKRVSDMIERRSSTNSIVKYVLSELESDKSST